MNWDYYLQSRPYLTGIGYSRPTLGGYLSPTLTGLCDIVLPAAHFLELSSPRSSQGSSGAMGTTVKCINPPGEAKFDGEIVRMLYEYKGVPYNVIPGFPEYPSVEEMLDMFVVGFEPKGWKVFEGRFQEHGWWDCKETEPELWGTYRRYETGTNRGRNAGGFVGTEGDHLPGFYTPTKKIEIWSTVIESFHPEGEWNLPTYREPPHSPTSDPEMYAEYPFIITTGRRIPVYFHSEHRQLLWCRERWPVPRVEINPDDAASCGIEQGDWVWIETPYGKIREVADLYYGIRPGVINCEHQWWSPEFKQSGSGHELCAVNHLIDNWARDPHCGASNLRAYLGKIYKATPENSPFGNPVPCDHDGVEIIHSPDDPRLKEWVPTYEGRE
ncbi:MAG: molybdopterin dinucleotide binding domain-containing protein [Gordonibacter sp.]